MFKFTPFNIYAALAATLHKSISSNFAEYSNFLIVLVCIKLVIFTEEIRKALSVYMHPGF